METATQTPTVGQPVSRSACPGPSLSSRFVGCRSWPVTIGRLVSEVDSVRLLDAARDAVEKYMDEHAFGRQYTIRLVEPLGREDMTYVGYVEDVVPHEPEYFQLTEPDGEASKAAAVQSEVPVSNEVVLSVEDYEDDLDI